MAGPNTIKLSRAIAGKGQVAEIPSPTFRTGVVTVASPLTVTIGDDPTPVVAASSDANYVPAVNDVVNLRVTDTEVSVEGMAGNNPSVFRNRFASSAIILTSTARAATTYGDLPSDIGPSVDITVTSSGILLVGFTCQIQAISDNDGGAVTVELSGANTVAASDDWRLTHYVGISGATNTFTGYGRTAVFTGLNPGLTTVTMKYKDLFDTGNDVLYARRQVWAEVKG